MAQHQEHAGTHEQYQVRFAAIQRILCVLRQ
jgi:hypothetical protein